MSELQHPAQVARLIGDARDPGELVRQIRERPFSVLLLDEIEKAHPIFFDTLMTVLDEGTVSDSLGRVTDFRRCIIVMTTNLGASAGTSAGFGERPHSTSLVDVRRHFRPEFFNRIDQVVPFAPLDVGTIDQIAAIELEAVGRREGLRLRRLTLRYGDAMVAHVARKGFDPRWGARLLQRTVEAEIVAPLARFLLDNPSIEGAEIFVDLEDGRAVIVAV
jgi:ATP-dependent Clp protease ATP-binding subunit ClpC